ncbi:hypothetical protein ID866_7669 [Astraeus odoratus]|nr:hypothetical protein ID866_7669 [Astraeus odoratus]
MQLHTLVALLTIIGGVNANLNRHARLVKKNYNFPRDPASTITSSATSSSSSSPSSSAPTSTSTTSGPSSGVSSGSSTNTYPTFSGTLPTATASGIPPLNQITSGMTSQSTMPPTATYSAGATPPISGAPVLPTPFVFQASDWPPQDQIAPTDSAEVSEWMQELDGFNIPDIPPTADGTCVGDPAAAADAADRGWWTCGGYTRDTDITACPDKLTWGVSFDDGPGFYTQYVE